MNGASDGFGGGDHHPETAKRHRRRDSWLSQVRGWFVATPSAPQSPNQSGRLPICSSTSSSASSPRPSPGIGADLALKGKPAFSDEAGLPPSQGGRVPPTPSSSLQRSLMDHLIITPIPPAPSEHQRVGSKLSLSLPSDIIQSESTLSPRKVLAAHVKHTRKIRFDEFACLLEAAVEGDLVEVQDLIESAGIHPDTCNADGVTAIHCAVGTARTDLVRYLLTKGANTNVADDHGWTPLHTAALLNNLELVKILLQHRADVEACDAEGQAPLGLPTDHEIIAVLSEAVQRKNLGEEVVALYDFDPSMVDNPQGDELCFSKNDRITILCRDDPDWWWGRVGNRQGMVPRQFVQ